MKRIQIIKQKDKSGRVLKTSRIPGFYRLSVEQRLAFLARAFDLTEDQISQLREGNALRIDHAVNMVENAVGVLGLPLGLGLNFLVDEREHLVPMAIEEASIIAAASKGALIIRRAGGFKTSIDEPIMIGQIQILELDDPNDSANLICQNKDLVINAANSADPKMTARGGGVFDLETRVIDGGADVGEMLIVHLLVNVCEAMGANAVNSACEAAGPVLQELAGGRVNLRILSNLADRRLARAEFRVPFEALKTGDIDGRLAATNLREASRLAQYDAYRAATHNKGIFNGICAAALALGQDWRAIEAGGHAFASRDGHYRGLTTFEIENNHLVGKIELPLQVGWVGGAVNSHPGVKILRAISGVENSSQLAGLLASVGLAQNFAACYALATDGIQKGHMALHARSVAISTGVPFEDVEKVASEMIRRGEVRVSAADQIYREMQSLPSLRRFEPEMPVESFARGKVILFGEHATVYNYPGIISTIDLGLKVRIKKDPHGPRFLMPHFKQAFPVPKSDRDVRLFSRAADTALEMYDLSTEPIAIEVESNLVPGMGLGSSASFSVALCSALKKYKGLGNHTQWDTTTFEDAQLLEAVFHGNPSGMDAATVLSGGVIWFRKGPPRELLPIRVPKPMTGLVCIVEPGARTIELVNLVQQNHRSDPDRIDSIFSDIGNLTVDAGVALGTGDAKAAGDLMVRNHDLLAKIGVSTPALDRAVDLLLDRGALGAKLTGAGGGGAVVALVKADQQYRLAEELKEEFALVFPFTLGSTI